MNVFEILRMRSEFEEIVLNFRVPGAKKSGTIANLDWFVNNGEERNHKNNLCGRALDIARTIIKYEKDRKNRKNGRRTLL